MTDNTHRDLDQSDVERDAHNMMQREFDDWGDQLDGADLFTIIQIMQEHNLLEGNPLHNSIIEEMIDATQSNPAKSTYALDRMIDLNRAMTNL